MIFRWLKAFFEPNHKARFEPISAPVQPTQPETWQDRVRRIQLPEDERQPVVSLVGSKDIYPSVDIERLIGDRVLRTGLTKGRPEDIQFVIEAHRAGKLLGDGLRKIGAGLTAEQKRSRGISYRGILTAEFLEILSEAGLQDPVQCAWVIGSSVTKAVQNAETLQRIGHADLYAHFMASSMAAGPCARAALLDGKRFKANQAPLPPFKECGWPDQCGCMYRGTLTQDGEF